GMQQHVLDYRIGALAVLHHLVEIALQGIGDLADLCPHLLSTCTPPSASRNSSISSTDTAEKLLTKLSGFLISCAIPAVNCPSEASFSVCTRRSWAVRKSSNDFANSRVRASTLSNRRTFSIAMAAWSAKVETNSICLSVNGLTSRRVSARTPIGTPSRNIGRLRMVRKPPSFCAS